MEMELPPPSANYFAAANQGHTEIAAHCFAANAVVRDEGQTIEGLVAIQQWQAETRRKYQHTIEPLAFAQEDGQIIVTNRITGKFPGSPIELDFVFTLNEDKIVSLEIRS